MMEVYTTLPAAIKRALLDKVAQDEEKGQAKVQCDEEDEQAGVPIVGCSDGAKGTKDAHIASADIDSSDEGEDVRDAGDSKGGDSDTAVEPSDEKSGQQ
ncbi:hypothetical protein PR002_g13836 [Phytophthora rubi]|uniref:Uncharacterized protein n=2 Tax=Phytophthora rubi TaxID=129364 RepID=A0A6A3LD26_9STRA|nr:hypothetical protein PR002_g13836 [Phytophthora rubi]